jgi:ubiquinone biosynthesis protein Coq4
MNQKQDVGQKDYFVPDLPEFTSDSPFLVSSSEWLNNPTAREYVATAAMRRNHKDVPTTYDITQVMPMIQPFLAKNIMRIEQLFMEERQRWPELDAWFKEGHVSTYTAESLGQYPEGSVGWLVHRYLVLNGFKADFTEGQPLGPTQYEYFQRRLSQQHDVEHVLAGFPLDYLGEAGVTFVRVGSYFKYLSPELAGLLNIQYTFLLGPLMTRTWLHYPETYNTFHDAMTQGIRVGRESEPVFMMKYEPILHLPVEEAREKLGYRGVVDMDLRAPADIWSEFTKVALDPRMLEAAE